MTSSPQPALARRSIHAALLLCVAQASAQTDTRIDAVQAQLQQQRARAESMRATSSARDVKPERHSSPELAYPSNDVPCFPVRRIALEGPHSSTFQWALRAASGAPKRCLGAGGVNAVLSRVQNALIEAGFVTTRVLAPQQDLRSGTLVLTLVPGTIGRIRAAENQGASVQVVPINGVPTSRHRLLNVRDVEQGLENFKRVPSADVDIQIVPGSQPGESDLVIARRQGRPWRVNVAVDDGGSKATGKYQANLMLAVDNPLRRNDLFSLSVSNDLNGKAGTGPRGTKGHAAHYSIPFGYWLLALDGNDYAYRQSVAGATQAYLYRGKSRNLTLSVSRVVYRDATRKVGLTVGAYKRSGRNFIDDTEVEVQRQHMGGYEFGITGKQFLGSATVNGNVQFKRGAHALSRSATPASASGDGSALPHLIHADLTAQLPFRAGHHRFDYQATWRAQWNRTALLAQDRFGIGGRYTIRGFDGESSLLAERGWLLRNELGWMPEHVSSQFYVFADYGAAGGPSAKALAGTRLGGAGAGWRGQWKGVQYDFFAGTPVVKPDHLPADPVATGFNLAYLF